MGAAEILDHRTIIRCVARESRREFYQIDTSAKKSHCLLPGFCSCASFCFQVAAKPEALVCKHLLAVQLASATSQLVDRTLDDAEWASQLSLTLMMAMQPYG